MIGRAKGSEKQLQDVLRRRERAEADAVTATVALGVTEAAVESRLQTLALSDCTPDAFHAGKVEAIGELQRSQAEQERTAAIVAALSVEADRLAVEVAGQRVEALTASVAALAVERDDLSSRLADVAARHDQATDDLAGAELAVSRAARWTDASRAKAEALEAQEAEVVGWHAQHDALHPERWPSHLRERIAVAVDVRRGEHAEARARLAEESRQNLAARGLDPVSASELGVGRRFPRL